MTFKVCCAQLNLVLGDMAGNAERIVAEARSAHQRGARVLLTPRLALAGGDAQDLFLRADFVAACESALRNVAEQTRELAELTLVIGHPYRLISGGVADGASVVRAGKVLATCARHVACTPESADALRYFVADEGAAVTFEVDGVRFAVQIGMHGDGDGQDGAATEADVVLVLEASPFFHGSRAACVAAAEHLARAHRAAVISANLVGGQDETVYAGGSLAMGRDGLPRGSAPTLREALFDVSVQPDANGVALQADAAPARDEDAELWHALVLALRDYALKSGFRDVALGLSGGIDSALVLALAVDALGSDHARVLLMPGAYTAPISLEDAHALARNLGVRADEVSILPPMEGFMQVLAPVFAGRAVDTTEENLQARVRGMLLMALSNKFGCLILETGNKSEAAVGYSTLYGDMCGGFAPITDVFKTGVYRLARWRNENDPFGRGASPIPGRIITRPPSAELRAEQTDQDSLPPYDVLDAIAAGYMERGQSVVQLIADGHDAEAVRRVVHLVHVSEFKRRQAAPGPRVSRRSFGSDWRYPIVNKFSA